MCVCERDRCRRLSGRRAEGELRLSFCSDPREPGCMRAKTVIYTLSFKLEMEPERKRIPKKKVQVLSSVGTEKGMGGEGGC